MKKFLILFLIVILCVEAFTLTQRFFAASSVQQIVHTAAPTPTPTIAPPITLTIPRLKVVSSIESVGMTQDGRMDVPKGVGNTAWYNLGPKPGEAGNAVIDGHFDTPTGAPSVFYYIGSLQKGDSIHVTTQDKKSYTFTVTSVKAYPDKGFPITTVFGPSTQKNLNLITCSGVWDRNSHNYSERTVVFTTLQTD